MYNVNGPYRFIQGLTTNDVEELSAERPIQYCMLLNVQGRVLYEVLLYRHKEQSCMIECDSSSIDGLVKHFKKYMLRSKVRTLSEIKHYDYNVSVLLCKLLRFSTQDILLAIN